MIQVIQKYKDIKTISFYSSIPHEEFLSLMRLADVMVGNSSSGIIESPYFDIPVVNIGMRQEGRERCDNVRDIPCNKEMIVDIIKEILENNNLKNPKKCTNLFGDGTSSDKIVDILSTIPINKALLRKRITY
jgi:UDP-N-acetylglucosamine 2-epimerase